MRKTKEYISDVQQKIIELHKLESDFKTKARAVKIPISTIRAIIKVPLLWIFENDLSCSV